MDILFGSLFTCAARNSAPAYFSFRTSSSPWLRGNKKVISPEEEHSARLSLVSDWILIGAHSDILRPVSEQHVKYVATNQSCC